MKNIIFISIFGMFLPFSFVFAGNVLSSHKYAWSDNVGYINFKDVIVDDDALSGYAWSTNKGFIKFDPAEGGVLNEGTGNLSGSAWGEQLGWIDFNDVNIDENGQFSGTATGDLVGTITFDCPSYCDVRTDWREASNPSSSTKTAESGDVSVDLSNIINPNTFSIPNEIFPAVTFPQKSSIVTADGGPASAIDALEESALFDVISEPVQYAKNNPIRFVIFSTIAEILILLLIISTVRRIRAYIVNKK